MDSESVFVHPVNLSVPNPNFDREENVTPGASTMAADSRFLHYCGFYTVNCSKKDNGTNNNEGNTVPETVPRRPGVRFPSNFTWFVLLDEKIYRNK